MVNPGPNRRLAVILAADLVGYSRLMQADEECAFASVRVLHSEIIAPEASQRGGRVFKALGDGFLIEFGSAVRAVEAAQAIQFRLAELGAGELQMRIGIALGDVIAQDDDLFGNAVNLAARIEQGAIAGEIRVSESVRQQVAGNIDAAFNFVGLVQYKNLAEPVPTYSVLPAQNSKRTSSVTPGRGRPINNLPARRNSFVGRRSETAQICKSLARADIRLLTITGPGGVGKTALALRVVERLSSKFDGNALLVRLGVIESVDLFWTAMAQPLSIKESPGTSLQEAVLAFMRNRPFIILFDNFEHIIGAAPYISLILQQAPNVTIVTTSRQRLDLVGEHEYTLNPLTVPSSPDGNVDVVELAKTESVQLFVQRAQAAKATFDLSGSNVTEIASLCSQLDGLPLAIELAAARVKLLAPMAIARRLQQGYGLLQQNRRDVEDRHRTLAATIAWSFELLSSWEAKVLACISVFPSSFDIEAASAACCVLHHQQARVDEPIADILESLTSLVDKSLVRHREQDDGEPRFFVLKTIRHFAAERLKSFDPDEAGSRCARGYFLHRAEKIAADYQRNGQNYAFEVIDQDYGNIVGFLDGLRLAPVTEEFCELRLSAALWPYWERRGYFEVGLRHIVDAMERAQGAPLNVLADALSGAGTMAWHRNSIEKAREFHSRALQIFRGLEDRHGIAFATNNLGVLALDQEDLEQAECYFRECYSIASAIHAHWLIVYSTHNLGEIMYRKGSFTEAIGFYRASLDSSEVIGDDWLIAIQYSMLGLVYVDVGELGTAKTFLTDALDRLSTIEDSYRIAECLENMALLAARRGEPAMVIQALAAADRIAERPKRPSQQRRCHELEIAARHALKSKEIQAIKSLVVNRPAEHLIMAMLAWEPVRSSRRPKNSVRTTDD